MVSMQRLLVPFVMCVLIFNGSGCKKEKEEPEETKTETKPEKPEKPEKTETKPEKTKPEKTKTICTVPSDRLKPILSDRVELEKNQCKVGAEIKQGEICPFKCQGEHDKRNDGKVTCRKDGSFYSTAKCTKSPLLEELDKYKRSYIGKMKKIQAVLKEASGMENNRDEKTKNNPECKNRAYDSWNFHRQCWEKGTRCQKISSLFERKICFPGKGYPIFHVSGMVDSSGAVKDVENSESCKTWLADVESTYEAFKGPNSKIGEHSKVYVESHNELLHETRQTIKMLTTARDSTGFLPEFKDADWDSKKQSSMPADKKWVLSQSPPEWKFRSNHETKIVIDNFLRTSPYRDPLKMTDRKSEILSLNCAPPVVHLLKGLQDFRSEMRLFREVEEDAPQKPSHIVLSA